MQPERKSKTFFIGKASNRIDVKKVEGFEQEEVARILGCSVGTSKSQLHKARLKLQKLLKKKANPRLIGIDV